MGRVFYTMKFHEGGRAMITLTESLQRQQIPAHMKKALKGSPIPLNIPTLSPELAPPTILTAKRLKSGTDLDISVFCVPPRSLRIPEVHRCLSPLPSLRIPLSVQHLSARKCSGSNGYIQGTQGKEGMQTYKERLSLKQDLADEEMKMRMSGRTQSSLKANPWFPGGKAREKSGSLETADKADRFTRVCHQL